MPIRKQICHHNQPGSEEEDASFPPTVFFVCAASAEALVFVNGRRLRFRGRVHGGKDGAVALRHDDRVALGHCAYVLLVQVLWYAGLLMQVLWYAGLLMQLLWYVGLLMQVLWYAGLVHVAPVRRSLPPIPSSSPIFSIFLPFFLLGCFSI